MLTVTMLTRRGITLAIFAIVIWHVSMPVSANYSWGWWECNYLSGVLHSARNFDLMVALEEESRDHQSNSAWKWTRMRVPDGVTIRSAAVEIFQSLAGCKLKIRFWRKPFPNPKRKIHYLTRLHLCWGCVSGPPIWELISLLLHIICCTIA